MTIKRYSLQEQGESNGDLEKKFYLDIIHELTDKESDFFQLLNPLNFADLFSKQILFVEENKARPLYIARILKNQSLNKKQFYFFYKWLIIYLMNTKGTDSQLKDCMLLIAKLQKNLDKDFEGEIDYKFKKGETIVWRFDEILEYLTTLPSYKEKIKYLFTIKAEYKQNPDYPKERIGQPTLAEQCEIEIRKLREIEKLEPSENTLENKQDKPNSDIQENNDLNIERATLFINYLLDFAKEKSRENFKLKNKKLLSDADKSIIVNFLTSYSRKQSKKLPVGFKNELFKIAEKEGSSEKFCRDMEVVRKYFEMIGLSEIINKIDADLGEK